MREIVCYCTSPVTPQINSLLKKFPQQSTGVQQEQSAGATFNGQLLYLRLNDVRFANVIQCYGGNCAANSTRPCTQVRLKLVFQNQMRSLFASVDVGIVPSL